MATAKKAPAKKAPAKKAPAKKAAAGGMRRQRDTPGRGAEEATDQGGPRDQDRGEEGAGEEGSRQEARAERGLHEGDDAQRRAGRGDR